MCVLMSQHTCTFGGTKGGEKLCLHQGESATVKAIYV